MNLLWKLIHFGVILFDGWRPQGPDPQDLDPQGHLNSIGLLHIPDYYELVVEVNTFWSDFVRWVETPGSRPPGSRPPGAFEQYWT